jgi:hypothetical protein
MLKIVLEDIMRAEYAQRLGEESHIGWLRRIYEMARATSSEKGWMGVDPELIAILLNNMNDLLPRAG